MPTPASLDFESLLAPISEDRPSGEDLRYLGPHDEMREARRADDLGSQGDWERQAKVADWDRVVELGAECLARRSKDLQIAAWMVEALTQRHGFAGLRDGLNLLRAIQDSFWETCFPEIEDDDLEMRAGPLNFLTRVLPPAIRSTPLTSVRGDLNFNFIDWKRSRELANELRKNPDYLDELGEVERGSLVTVERFDKQVAHTDRAFYEALVEEIREAQAALKALDESNDRHFGHDAPSLGEIRKALEDCLRPATSILASKPARPVEDESARDDDEESAWSDDAPDWGRQQDRDELDADVDGDARGWGKGTDEPEQSRRRRPSSTTRGSAGPIADAEDARSRVIEAAEYLRRLDPAAAESYLIVRALRLGELYGLPRPIESSQLPPPSTGTRQSLRRLAAEGDWERLLEEAEQALGRPEGRGWLDAHRLAVLAMMNGSEADRSRAADGSLALLRAVLSDFPEWPNLEMDDGTPAAGAETLAWLRDHVTGQVPSVSAQSDREPEATFFPEPSTDGDRPTAADGDDESREPEPHERAAELARRGRVGESIQVLRQAMAQAPDGRTRFLRKLQLAELCVGLGRHAASLPLAEDLARQVEDYRLEDWEGESLIARVLVALYRCLKATEPQGSERLRQAYARLCRLDIGLALGVASEGDTD